MYNGLIVVRKEKGYTSGDVVAILRGILRQKKIGHTGTLDPDAEGVLPVCLGHATRIAELLTAEDKEYEARMLLGTVTDTQDSSGKVLEKSGLVVNRETFLAAAGSFTGTYMQTPPMYSAVKIGGRRLYEIARKGGQVDRPARAVEIKKLAVTDFSWPEAGLTVCCSKGTYIRTLCHDIGQKLGCGGCMTSLVRTRSGRFGLQEARTLEEIRLLAGEGRLGDCIIPLEALLPECPAAYPANDAADRMLQNGNSLREKDLSFAEPAPPKDGQLVRMFDRNGTLTALYRFQDRGRCFKAYKMFISP